VACIEQGNSASGVAVMVILDEGGHCFQASDRFYLSCVRCDAMRCDRSLYRFPFCPFVFLLAVVVTIRAMTMTELGWLGCDKECRSRPNIEGRGTSPVISNLSDFLFVLV
jgi:hypothetical protein